MLDTLKLLYKVELYTLNDNVENIIPKDGISDISRTTGNTCVNGKNTIQSNEAIKIMTIRNIIWVLFPKKYLVFKINCLQIKFMLFINVLYIKQI